MECIKGPTYKLTSSCAAGKVDILIPFKFGGPCFNISGGCTAPVVKWLSKLPGSRLPLRLSPDMALPRGRSSPGNFVCEAVPVEAHGQVLVSVLVSDFVLRYIWHSGSIELICALPALIALLRVSGAEQVPGMLSMLTRCLLHTSPAAGHGSFASSRVLSFDGMRQVECTALAIHILSHMQLFLQIRCYALQAC